MLQELMPLLPDPKTLSLWVAMGGSLLGAALWILGARFSRYLVTLSAVAVGALVGKELPGRLGWTFEPMATTVIGALVAGVLGYVLHRFWVAMGLGVVLAVWTAAGVWAGVEHDHAFAWPAVSESSTVRSVALDVWDALPDRVTKILPFAAGAAMVSGLAIGLLWKKVGTVLMYSLTGVSLLVGMGLLAVNIGRPHWLELIPSATWAQLSVVFALVLVGVLVQWKLAPAGGSVKKLPKAASEDDDDWD